MDHFELRRNVSDNLTASLVPEVITYDAIKPFLRDLLSHFKSQGYSFRQLVKLVGRRAPNYFQRVIEGNHLIPPETCAALGKLAAMNSLRLEYFDCLCQLQFAVANAERENIRSRMQQLCGRLDASLKISSSIEEKAEYSMVLAAISTRNIASLADLLTLFHRKLSKEKISSAIAYLEKTGDIKLISYGYQAVRTVLPPFVTKQRNTAETQEYFLLQAVHVLRSHNHHTLETGMTAALCQTQVQRITALLQDCREEMINVIVEDHLEPKKIMRLQLSLFEIN